MILLSSDAPIYIGIGRYIGLSINKMQFTDVKVQKILGNCITDLSGFKSVILNKRKNIFMSKLFKIVS